MMKKITFSLAIVAMAITLVGPVAHAATSTMDMSADEFAQTKILIDKQIACADLSADQLNAIGDYYMEQMMPGAAHKRMEAALGGDGSESLKQAHIFLAHRWYCGDTAGYGMMGMMGGYGIGQNYTGGMMGTSLNTPVNRSFGMMGEWGAPYGYGERFGLAKDLLMIMAIAFLGTGIAAFVKYLRGK